jgi:cytochrome c
MMRDHTGLLSISLRVSVLLSVVGAVTLASGCTGTKGNAAHGKELYVQCQACHKPNENYVGPKHCGVIGRPAGSVPGFDYSEGMKAAGLTWDEANLDQFLTSPVAFVNGTKMGFAGFDNPNDRADVIAWLRKMNDDPSLCPKKN